MFNSCFLINFASAIKNNNNEYIGQLMKNKILGFGLSIMALAAVTSCGNSGGSGSSVPASKNATAKNVNAGALPNYRFINFDTICARYNLAIDFTEQMMRLQNNYDSEEKKMGNHFQSRYQTFMQKQEAMSQERVQLPSEMEALQKEGQSLESYYKQSQQSLMKLQMEIQETMQKNSQTIVDSLKSFLRGYVAANGYDAVFFSESAPCFNPALDVTDEVVEGLNARYNKVKK